MPLITPVDSRSATISECGKYRYDLKRAWKREIKKRVCWIMLNPSTADGMQDDPTIRRCMTYSRTWGYDAMVVVNLFAYRATDPRALASVDCPIGPKCDEYIFRSASSSTLIMCAWGTHGTRWGRGEQVLSMLHDAEFVTHCLGTTQSGQPKHPLYLTLTATPFEYTLPPDTLQ